MAKRKKSALISATEVRKFTGANRTEAQREKTLALRKFRDRKISKATKDRIVKRADKILGKLA